MNTGSRLQGMRTSHSKTRSGCRTCKIRRVKCDESKPECTRCTYTGRKCDGYEEPNLNRRWIIFKPTHRTLSGVPREYVADEESRSCIGFFRLVSCIDLSTNSDQRFWCQTAIQAGDSSAPVRHALLAIASLHRSFRNATSQDPYADTQYSLAVRELINEISQSKQAAQDVALVCAVLFITIEVLRENEIGALGHLESAIRLLQEPRTSSGRNSETAEELLPLFSRLDLDASMFLGIRTPNLPISSPTPSLSSTRRFLTITEASDALNALDREAVTFKRSIADDFRYRIVGDIPLEIIDKYQCLLKEFSFWDSAFEDFLRHMEAPTQSSPLHRRKMLLQVQHKMAFTMLRGCLEVEEIAYDCLSPAFNEILHLSMTILEADGVKAQSFTVERGVLHPLYWTTLKCRDPNLRRRALTQLRRCPREGVWIAQIQARVAERVIELEECPFREEVQGTSSVINNCHGIPEFHRIHSVDLRFDKPRRTIQMTYQRRLNGLDGEWDTNAEYLSY